MLFMPNEIYYMEISAEVYEALHRLQVTDQFFVCCLVGANASMHQEHWTIDDLAVAKMKKENTDGNNMI